MQTFTDTAGRTWELTLTIGAVKRIKGSELKVDLLKINSGKPTVLTRLATEIELLIDVIWLLVKPQADQLGIEDLAFAEALGGEVATKAIDCFWKELLDFFQQLGRTQDQRAVEKMGQTMLKAIARATEKIDAINVDEVVETGMSTEIPGE